MEGRTGQGQHRSRPGLRRTSQAASRPEAPRHLAGSCSDVTGGARMPRYTPTVGLARRSAARRDLGLNLGQTTQGCSKISNKLVWSLFK